MTLELNYDIDGKEHHVIAHGCGRDFTRALTWSKLAVLNEHGEDVTGRVDDAHLPAIRARLLCAYIAQVGVRDANETEVGA